MFVYWANEAKNPSFEANNFRLWVRSHGSYFKIDLSKKQNLDVYFVEIRTKTRNLNLDEYYKIIDVMNSYFDKDFRKNKFILTNIEGDEYVFSENKT